MRTLFTPISTSAASLLTRGSTSNYLQSSKDRNPQGSQPAGLSEVKCVKKDAKLNLWLAGTERVRRYVMQ